jgi:hypothetical protein
VNHQLQSEIIKLGGDPSDSVWQWFVINGPHGPHFTWGQTRREPAGYVGLEHLREIVTERASADSEFVVNLRDVVRRALASENLQLLRRAIQVAAVVGGAIELERIVGLIKHTDQNVSTDARACLYILRRRVEP